MHTPQTTTSLARRAVLRGAAVAVLATAAAPVLVACGSDDSPGTLPEPDPLIAQADRARYDAALATAAAATLPDLAAALGIVAAERSAHADALAAEVVRAAAETSTAPPVPVAPTAPPTLDELRSRLTDSAGGAATLSRTLSGYRAGLLGSISAACTAQVAVLLR